MDSNPIEWDPADQYTAGWSQHYECRPCCHDQNVCSIEQCSNGLRSPGCPLEDGFGPDGNNEPESGSEGANTEPDSDDGNAEPDSNSGSVEPNEDVSSRSATLNLSKSLKSLI